ncbi:unnamed protein product [Adineta steineri]|uniref:Calponin-homology (CH) domain-containing protein n=1 Tax=Adineta steineri TaxID=433720 RepID=A0A818ZNX2_9BILA|nr:unnamed protein product [Adineta steineri]
MDERDGVEYPEQQSQHRQSLVKKNKSEIKQEKKMSKTESRFKSKLESLKKLQHSASTNSAVEKARAFFRSLELKHLGGSSNHEQSSSSTSSRRRVPTTTTTTTTTNNNNNINLSSSGKFPLPSSMSSSSSSSIIDDSHNTMSITTTNDSSFNTKIPADGIATARLIRVINPNYSNSNDMIINRVLNNEQNDHQLPASHLNFQHILMDKNIQLPKQYYNERSQSYSVAMEKHREIQQPKYDSRALSPTSAINANIIYSSHNYPNTPPSNHSNVNNRNISNNQMSSSLYNYRPLVIRRGESPSLMSSSFHEQSPRVVDSVIRPIPSSASSSSMSTWTQSVRRLNTEYTSTINALQQAKESFHGPTDKISKYANLVARGINNLSNNESKKSLGVTFCLTAPITPDSPSLSHTSTNSVQQSKTLPSNMFCKPKIVRPLDLNTFIPSIPSLPKLESISSNFERDNEIDSIANIIKKFNNLNPTSSSLKSSMYMDNNTDLLLSQLNKEQQESLPQIFMFDSVQNKKDQSNISSLTSLTDINPSYSISTPRVHFEPSITTYEIEDIPYESPPSSLTTSSSSTSSSSSPSSSASEDTTSSSSSTSTDENQIYEHTESDNIIQEETTYTIETFYKSSNNHNNHINNINNNNNIIINNNNNNNKVNSSPINQQVVVIRENTTEEQFNLAREKHHHDKILNHEKPTSQRTYTLNETEVPPLTTPLFTYLNSTSKQTAPTSSISEKQQNHHSIEPSTQIANDFTSYDYHDEDDATIHDVIAVNPHTHSPPSHCLTSSSSSTSTASSASTVLLSNNNINIPVVISDVTKKIATTNGNLVKTNNKSISQLPKRTTNFTTATTTTTTTITEAATATITNAPRLKQPSKIISPPSKLKPPSTTITKPLKSMITNSTSSVTTTMTTPSIRKPSTITNQSSVITNNTVNKTTQQQSSLSTLAIGKKQNLVNGTNMTESQTPTDSSCSIGKNRVRSMVNQLNAAVSSTRPAAPSIISVKRTTPTCPPTVNSRRPGSTESIINSTPSTTKTTITSPNRPTLQRAMTINNNSSGSPSTSSTTNNNIPSAYKRKTPLIRSTSNVKEGLLRWCQVQVADYPNVSVTNLSSSWSDGLAFCALTHHFFPDAFDFNSLSSTNRKENFELAFRTAEERAGIPRLLDVSDMLIMGNTPDYKCIFTYLNSFLAKVKDIHPITNGIEHN